MDRYEIVLSGFGGQGIVLGGIILAEAAAIYEDINATHNQSYGPEARGGASKSEVIISKKMIHFPEIEHPDVLVALTQEAANKFASTVKDQGVLIADSGVKIDEQLKERIKVYILPISETAIKVTGSIIVANMVTLGALVAITGVVSYESLQKAVLYGIPKKMEAINMKALAEGYNLAKY